MSIITFMQSLVPTSERTKVKNSAQNLIKILNTQAIPSCDTAAKLFTHDWKFKNDEMSKLNAYLSKALPERTRNNIRGANMVMLYSDALHKLTVNLAVIEDLIPTVFSSEAISTTAANYQQANVLQYLDAAEFFVRYTRTLNNYVTSVELAELQNIKVLSGVGPDDLHFLASRRVDYVSVAAAMCRDVATVKKEIKSVTPMTVTADSDQSANIIVGASKLDPFGFSTLPFPMSVIFRYRLSKLDKVMDELEVAEVEANTVEYRILLIKERLAGGQGDALLERKLEIEEDRLLKLKRRIAQIEEGYGA